MANIDDPVSDHTSDEDLEKDSVEIRKPRSKCTKYHVAVFLLTFFRKSFSNVKSTIVEVWTCNENASFPGDPESEKLWCRTSFCSSKQECDTFLGTLDTVFLGCYAVGLYTSGMLGDRFDPRIVLSCGMWLAAILAFVFGYVTEVFHYYSRWTYILLWGAQGLVQASGWPTEVCIMGNWFGKSSRGLLFGIWSACASVGNIIGSLLASVTLSYGYEYTFLLNSTILFSGGVVIFFGLVAAPRERLQVLHFRFLWLPDPDQEEEGEEKVVVKPEISERAEAISFWRAVLLPGVIAYSLAYACLKMVNYSFFFWLPYYLENNFHWSNEVSDELSTWYDWGGIVGGILAGLLTDMMGCRAPVMSAMLLISMFSLYGYSKSPPDKLVNSILMGIAGFFIGGPANLISSAISADLGKAPEILGNAEALSTVTGIMDGTGSVGAALGQILVPLIENWWGWFYVFYLFILMAFLTAACIGRATVLELKEFVHRCHFNYVRWRAGEISACRFLCGDYFSCAAVPFVNNSSGYEPLPQHPEQI